MATIKHVAALACVSISTVSRVLNGDPRARPDTIRKVREAAESLGYSASPLGRALRTRSQSVWALIIGDIENPLFTGVTRGVEDVASAAGYSVLLCNADESELKEREYLRVAGQLGVAGVLITPADPGLDISPLKASGIPVVALDRPIGGRVSPVDLVLVDTRSAARQAVEQLVAQGARRIACVTGTRETFTTTERVAGYREALQDAGLTAESALVRYTDFRINTARQAAVDLLSRPEVDGVLVTSSLMTVGTLEGAAQVGRAVGVDLHVAAFDDAPWTSLLNPAVIRVSQPAYDLGASAARLLHARIRSPRTPLQTLLLSAQVLPGGSPPASADGAGRDHG